jgi:hypothetical protein
MLEALLPDYHIWIKVTSGAVIPLIVDGPLDDNGTLSTATSVTSGAVFQHRPRERRLTLRVGRPVQQVNDCRPANCELCAREVGGGCRSAKAARRGCEAASRVRRGRAARSTALPRAPDRWLRGSTAPAAERRRR